MYTVYMHICPNGKKYIGITGQKPEKRWQNGKGYAYGSNDYFYNAIKKYGWENIEHKILHSGLTKDEAEQLEIELIAKYKTTSRKFGYNIDNGGTSCGKHTEEYKIRMSNIQKEVWKNADERRKKLSELRLGTHLSEETKEKLRMANIGKKYPKEVGEKRGEKLKGRKRPEISEMMKCLWQSGKIKGTTGRKGGEKQREAARKNVIIATNASKKPVIQYDTRGNYIAEYESAEEAKRAIKKPHAQISEVCKGKRKSTYGFVFKFKEEE